MSGGDTKMPENNPCLADNMHILEWRACVHAISAIDHLTDNFIEASGFPPELSEELERIVTKIHKKLYEGME